MKHNPRKPKFLPIDSGNHAIKVIEFDINEKPYNKGTSANITIPMNFSHEQLDGVTNLKINIELAPVLYGLSYNDLKKISKWANQAAEWKKKIETKQHRFDPTEG